MAPPSVRLHKVLITGVCVGEQRDHSSVVGAASAHCPVHFKML